MDPSHPPRLLRRRKWLLRLIWTTVSLQLVELASMVVVAVAPDGVPSLAGLQQQRSQLLATASDSTAAGTVKQWETIHPYLGFVIDPSADSADSRAYHGVSVSRHGFLDDKQPVQHRDDNRFIVGIFGGSFASWVFLDARKVLVERLQHSPMLGGRDIVVVNAALGGYKQPQQLMTLGWLLSLGGEFDAVVNIDGFNEVVLPPIENIPKRVCPFYPRNWLLRTNEIPHPTVLRIIGTVELLRERRLLAARAFSSPVVSDSAFANLVWWLTDRSYELRIARGEHRLLDADLPDERYTTSGPFEPFLDDPSMYASLAAVWARSSIQMSRIATANGASYHHFLQPNQYLEGTKKLTDSELEVAIDDDLPFAAHTRAGYPYLFDAARELRAARVPLHDLTGIFSSIDGDIYRDSCCHVNRAGNEIVATTVAAAILADLEGGHVRGVPG